MRPGAKTLIIGPGGGWDVARALASGSHDITGVEINPIIATTVMRERFVALSRGIYCVRTCGFSWRTAAAFVRRSQEKYQVVQATLVDTWASTAAGAFALSENNLYTTDALRDYLMHLTDDGMVAFTRWGLDPPRESLRLVSLAMEALKQLGRTGSLAARDCGAGGFHPGLGRAGHRADLAQAVQRRRISRARATALAAANMQADLHARGKHTRPVHRTAAQSRPGRIRAQISVRHFAGRR